MDDEIVTLKIRALALESIVTFMVAERLRDDPDFSERLGSLAKFLDQQMLNPALPDTFRETFKLFISELATGASVMREKLDS